MSKAQVIQLFPVKSPPKKMELKLVPPSQQLAANAARARKVLEQILAQFDTGIALGNVSAQQVSQDDD